MTLYAGAGLPRERGTGMRSDLGVTAPAWNGRRAAEALQRVKSLGRKRRSPCWECEQPIDYSLPSTHPDGCTVQHVKSRKLFPELTWDPSNWKPCHKACNESAGSGDRGEKTGVTSQEW